MKNYPLFPEEPPKEFLVYKRGGIFQIMRRITIAPLQYKFILIIDEMGKRRDRGPFIDKIYSASCIHWEEWDETNDITQYIEYFL